MKSSTIFNRPLVLRQCFLAISGVLALGSGLFTAPAASAQTFADPLDWKETDVPPPPAFDMAKLLTFEVARFSNLVYGVDPASVSISNSDGIVRYVMVASNPSGAKNVIYEGLRCSTGEVKIYARAKPDGSWVAVEKPEWKSMFDVSVPKHSARFAQAGACRGASAVGSVFELIKNLTTSPTPPNS